MPIQQKFSPPVLLFTDFGDWELKHHQESLISHTISFSLFSRSSLQRFCEQHNGQEERFIRQTPSVAITRFTGIWGHVRHFCVMITFRQSCSRFLIFNGYATFPGYSKLAIGLKSTLKSELNLLWMSFNPQFSQSFLSFYHESTMLFKRCNILLLAGVAFSRWCSNGTFVWNDWKRTFRSTKEIIIRRYVFSVDLSLFGKIINC